MLAQSTPFFVFDVESVGLHGEGFAVAGGVYVDGSPLSEFRFCCPPSEARGEDSDREWVALNVPTMEASHASPAEVRDAFWLAWLAAKSTHPDINMAGECIWPVEAAFVTACIQQDLVARAAAGPYPFHDIASFMLSAGMDPLASYERIAGETPCHEPLADARQSARLLAVALGRL